MADKSPFTELQLLLSDFSEEALIKKQAVLNNCMRTKVRNLTTIQQYHNNLLFLLAYAQNVDLYLMAQEAMRNLTGGVKNNTELKKRLTASGIAGTSIQGAYSLALTQWLLQTFPGKVYIHSFDKEGVHPKEVLKNSLPEAEFELLNDEKLNPLKWLEKASGTKNKNTLLQWLVNHVNNIEANGILKDQLFESMKLFIEINPASDDFSRSFGEINISKIFFHPEGLLKKFNEQELIHTKLPPEKKLTTDEKKQIARVSRIALCLLNRETDPITYSEELNIKYFELERGLSIALFSIDKERRLPIESYIGFMMFKNGHPMSYGGAWLFGERALIGINIFEAFRGGESAIVFAQLLRTYKMAFGIKYIEVEPYQFGKDNPEGIRSGAFWFYYRFGFRPCDERLRELSEQEYQKIISSKGYRTSFETLKLFTKSNLYVQFEKTGLALNPEVLSMYVTKRIKTDFKGDRTKAGQWCRQKLKEEMLLKRSDCNTAYDKLYVFYALCLNWKKISGKEKDLLKKIMFAKEGSEFEYIRLLNSFPFEGRVVSDLQIN